MLIKILNNDKREHKFVDPVIEVMVNHKHPIPPNATDKDLFNIAVARNIERRKLEGGES